jgi:hypothetical protein
MKTFDYIVYFISPPPYFLVFANAGAESGLGFGAGGKGLKNLMD